MDCPYFKITDEMKRPERCFPGRKHSSKLYRCGKDCEILTGINRMIKSAVNPFVEIRRTAGSPGKPFGRMDRVRTVTSVSQPEG